MSIGQDTVVGAGAVVTKDLPAGVVAAGVPARILREIGEDDRVEVPGAVTYDRDFWEERWSEVPPSRAAERPPNAHLSAEVADLPPGRALDAGCGHGSDALWLAARGWQVTGVDFSATALSHARSAAEAAGAEIEWVEGDLATWAPQPGHYDLVVCLYVHVAGSVEEMVRRMAAASRRGGTLARWSATTPPAIRCRSPSTTRSPRSIPIAGRSSSPRSARAPRRAPASTP